MSRAPRGLAEVRAALAAAGLRPHKRFGQNFLAEIPLLDRIVDAAGVRAGDVVLEVGPGLGTLTDRLLLRGARVVAVEIDHGLARVLRAAFVDAPGLVLVEGDVMGARGRLADAAVCAVRTAMADAGAPGFHVVSNLPYGISTPFLSSLARDPGPPLRACVMLQAEVAASVRAAAGADAYTAFSAFMRTYFAARTAFAVPRHLFHPQPDVDSVVVTLDPRPAPHPDPDAFGRFLQTLFQGRRKALRTTLRARFDRPDHAIAEILRVAGVDPGARVDAVEPETLGRLFEVVTSWQP